MRLLTYLFLALILSTTIQAQEKTSLIPKVMTMETQEGFFTINSDTKVISNTDALPIANLLTENFGLDQTFDPNIENLISFQNAPFFENEAYSISITEERVIIKAGSGAGHFYAFQTLLQLITADQKLPLSYIEDKPRLAYRGLMLDVSRHFMPKEFVKKLIDVMAFYKLNTLHWHLTDDQGWRIEIKQYPKLTEVGSVRSESMIGHYSDEKYDGKPYGGFYTQDDIKEIVAYAETKFVTIIPEIEMPGHAVAALSSYPELGCSGGPYKVRSEWGVATDVFCPYEETFTFLENVLSEVMALFPSKYIHIGGDECPKDSWKASEFCQNLIKEKDLGDEHGLQSYFITRIDEFVSSKGKKIIGWDEILEGGLSPNATVMSWRGVAGGIEAAKQGHDVIMTPNSHLYLDYYQGNPDSEPLAIGGFLPLDKTYSFDPIPSELTEEEGKFIVGVQGNLWTEYVTTTEQAEYMYFPRALAVAEVGWTTDRTKNYSNFAERVQSQFKNLKKFNINYSQSMYSITMDLLSGEKGKVKVALNSPIPSAEIRFNTDGTAPTLTSPVYTNKGIEISKNAEIKARLFQDDEPLGHVFSQSIIINKITGSDYKSEFKPTKYKGGSSNALTNGIKGSVNRLEEWVGINGENLNVVFELDGKTKFSKISLSFLHAPSSWIMLPKSVTISGSKDGINYQKLGEFSIDQELNPESRLENVSLKIKGKKLKKLKIEATNFGPLPANHPGKGSPSWLFVDEIEVE
ncbi:hexosaminidase [Spirosomataceae bacterium TFI 002]|nr:hexosaminidase [Spirosomataceae bacterium TFI 002]